MLSRLFLHSLFLLSLYAPVFAESLVGKKLHRFELNDLVTHKLVTSDDLPSQPYVLHFWSSWCHTCHKDHPSMLKLAQRYPIISIVVSDDNHQVKEWLDEHSNPYLYILDDYNSQVAMDLHIPFAPYTLLIDGNGKILKEQSGLMEDINNFLWVS